MTALTHKTYGQLCPIARALDLLGDRWTLLLVREFLLGPKRFKELLAALPSMGTNRLSQRLALLSENGVIVPSAEAAPAYELTDKGEQLRSPLVALGIWGLDLPVDSRIKPTSARAELIALCLAGVGGRSAAAKLRGLYEFEVGTEVFHMRVADGELLPRSGPSPEPADLRVQCDLATFIALAQADLAPGQALTEGRVTLGRGNAAAFEKMFEVLRYDG